MNELIGASTIDLHALKLVCLVARARSFTRAGEKAGLTQSAVTRAVRNVEERLGVSLFQRTTRSVKLTPAGAAFVGRAEALLNEAADIGREMKQRFGLAKRTLAVGLSRSVGVGYLPAFFSRFRRDHPEVEITVREGAGGELLSALRGAELDVAIVTGGGEEPVGIDVCHQFKDRFVLVSPQGSGIPSRLGKAQLRDLSGATWISLAPPSASAAAISDWFTGRGLKPPRPKMRPDSFDLIVNLVAQGLGIAIVPRRVLPLYAHRRPVAVSTLVSPPERTLWIAARSMPYRSTAIDQFVASVLF